MIFIKATKVWVRQSSWAVAAAWGAGTAGLLSVAWGAEPDRAGGGLIAAISNGVLLLFLVAGISVIDNLRRLDPAAEDRALLSHPWLLAAVPTVATLLALLPLRVIAITVDLQGPWSSLDESTVDIVARAAIVWIVLGIVGTAMTRRTDEPDAKSSSTNSRHELGSDSSPRRPHAS